MSGAALVQRQKYRNRAAICRRFAAAAAGGAQSSAGRLIAWRDRSCEVPGRLEGLAIRMIGRLEGVASGSIGRRCGGGSGAGSGVLAHTGHQAGDGAIRESSALFAGVESRCCGDGGWGGDRIK